MFVEGTLRWQVTEDSPWDLLLALCLRDLGGLAGIGAPSIPAVAPTPVGTAAPVAAGRTLAPVAVDSAVLAEQWTDWWTQLLDRHRRPIVSSVQPPHFSAFDRTLELRDLVIQHYDDAVAWTEERFREYTEATERTHAARAADIVQVVRDREHDLRRQAAYFRLDLVILPLAQPGAWIVGPDTVVVAASLRADSAAFRAWFTPLVEALV